MKLPMPEYFCIEELAARWKVHSDKIHRYLDTGQLKGHFRVDAPFGSKGKIWTDQKPQGGLGCYEYYILREEVERWENEYGGTLTKDAVSANKSAVDYAPQLHPRKERSLLTIINALLGVIDGGYPSNAVVKHPSIKNQSDLVVKIAEAKEPGMSKANLEKVFAEAKRQAETDQ